jgi:tetratricopeptide (TPR) repeat protein
VSIRLLLVALAAAGTILSAQANVTRGLTGVAELERGYDAVLDARFDEVTRLAQQACGPAPREACLLLEALNVWWQIQLDPHDTARDPAFTTRVEAAIAAADAWTKREPRRAEAWFYLGGAFGARVQWRSLRGQQVAAARDGKRIKDALERALALDPGLQDAWFGVGLYHYYAAVAPAAARVLRFLLLLPGGDRQQGLQEMLRAREGGRLVRSEADYQLHLIYIWYEQAPRASLELLAGLRERHATNPLFYQAAADIQQVYFSDFAGSLRTWEALLAAARAGQVRERALAETTARLGAARQLDRLRRGDAAIEHLRAIIAAKPSAPYGALSLAHVHLGELLARAGRMPDAAAQFRLALATTPPRDPHRVRARANSGLRAVR